MSNKNYKKNLKKGVIMNIDPINSLSSVQNIGQNKSVEPKEKNKIDKSTEIFKESVTVNSKQTEDELAKSNREYLITDIMHTKGVSREVAEAECDFFYGEV